MTFFTTIAFLAAGQGLFLGLLLVFLRRGQVISNQNLGCLIIVYSLWTAEFSAYFTEQFFHYPHLLFVTINIPLLFGPLLYFYAESLISKKHPFLWTLLHLLPFFIFLGLQLPYFLTSASDKIEVLQALQNLEDPPNYSTEFFSREIFKSLHLILYLWVSLRVYLNWKNANAKNLEQKIRMRWLLILILGLGLYALFDIVHFLGLYFFAYDYLFLIAKGVLLTGASVIYYIGYLTIRRPISLDELNTSVTSEPKIKYAKSGLNMGQAVRFREKLEETMDQQKPYLDPNLNLQTLSNIVGISPHHISQVVNTHLDKSFSEFITEYRIAAAKEKLANPSNLHFTILSIAYDSGFKNKASFNNAFKKITGITPSAFRADQS